MFSLPFPDPSELRALADRIEAAARAARRRADHLGQAIAESGWQGPAARAFDAQAALALGALHRAAGRLDDSASALRRHADRVDAMVATLAGLVRGGLATVPELLALPGDALREVADGGGRIGHAAGRAAEGALTTVRDVAGSALDCVGL